MIYHPFFYTGETMVGGTRVEPNRHLISPVKPHRYVPAMKTNVQRTWRKARLLAFIRRNKAAPDVPSRADR